MDLVIVPDDPRVDDVRALLATHLAFSHEVSPAEHVHALDADGLVDSSVTFFSARQEGVLVGVGALRQLDDERGELKSMHTAAAARGQGIGRAMVGHLLAVARERGYRWVGLETGTGAPFAPAHALYAATGFTTCPPFGAYTDNPDSTCMQIELAPRA